MAIQFKEIKAKTEDLMEQGNEAQRNVAASKTKVGQAQKNLDDAMAVLERASRTDEDGNPAGDVGAAQVRVNVAQSQLAESKRALGEAQKHLESVNENKRKLAEDIESHNEVERSNLDKLKALRSKAFADSSDGLSAGIVERLNEAEDARAELLGSLGEHIEAERSGGGTQTWGSVSLKEIDTSGGALDARTSGNSEGSGDSVPLAVPGQTGFVSVPSDFNGHPAADIKASFDYADRNYGRSSSEWQENANRMIEVFDSHIAALDKDIDESRSTEKRVFMEMERHRMSHGEDADYEVLYMMFAENRRKTSELMKQRRNTAMIRDSLKADLDPAQATTFRGFGGKNFDRAYDGLITSRQGKSVEGMRGTCGINDSCSCNNQQWGTRIDEKYGIQWFVDNGECTTDGTPGSNGGTSFVNRKKFLNAHSVSLTNEYGERDTGTRLTLEHIASRFYSGDSCGLVVKASDLSQPGIDTKSRQFRFGFKQSVAEHNARRFKSNHITTVAGFSYYESGTIAGIWLNDTGGWAGGNRVFIPADKFYEMQEQTEGFSVEFARKMLS